MEHTASLACTTGATCGAPRSTHDGNHYAPLGVSAGARTAGDAVGGAAQVLAQKVVRVPAVHMLEEFGSPEAIWEFEVVKFPVVVTMDSHGDSLHAKVEAASSKALDRLIR